MINKIFEDTFNVFVNTLNVINAHKNSRGSNINYEPDSLKRISDTINFILNRQDIFELDLEAVKNELVQIKKEIANLQKEKKTTQSPIVLNFFIYFAYLFSTLEGLVDGLISEVDSEIEKRKEIAKKEEEIKKKRDEELNRIKKELSDKKTTAYDRFYGKKDKVKKQKIKVFKSAFAEEIEREMNDFLGKNDIEVINILQNIDKEVVVLTIIYKEI